MPDLLVWIKSELAKEDNARTNLFVHQKDLIRHQVRAQTLREVLSRIERLDEDANT